MKSLKVYMGNLFSVFRTPTLTEELSHAIIARQREVIQREIEQIKMNHKVLESKAILAYLSDVSQEIISASSDPINSVTSR